jgi:hypothetical protein
MVDGQADALGLAALRRVHELELDAQRARAGQQPSADYI